ncbi:uncharacterized protein LOC130940534 [Arachis stenosperma]|uniref:uncharacterized protein LOC130940534 n=1 Tax=Arachis stenosperma TaxID=217475 RepID=UPI0025AD0878|nr:uncharacterized protein LOC130940534 [Arachis stenosperma]
MVGCSATFAVVTARSYRHGCRLPSCCCACGPLGMVAGGVVVAAETTVEASGASAARKTLPPPLSPKTAAQSSVLEFIASCRRSGHPLRRWCYRNCHRCCRYLVPLSTSCCGYCESGLELRLRLLMISG